VNDLPKAELTLKKILNKYKWIALGVALSAV